ncbi:uncharacterized protein LOC107040370 [Diachasma alloeum]|uniref:uncharacterized protein LOC107040370 n=1 Tax=Diachasma alloeum TaxID=454923 RepID=UPI00073816E9|nr:uncharacterized protein LOC107040370 [Diachasma alloeum]
MTEIMEASRLLSKPTLVRRVSDLFKDSNTSGSQLFTHSSMQKLRHCCQNLNLFPYLLYSLGDVKNTTQKLTINQLITTFTDRLFQLYLNIRLIVHSKLQPDPQKSTQEAKGEVKKFTKFERQKRKPNSLLLILAVYLAPLVLVFQLVGILSLLVFGKYTPGFVFLLSALLFLGYISMKVLFHDNDNQEYKKRAKRKID